MDFHPSHPALLPPEDEALHEHFDVVAHGSKANEDQLEFRNFHLQPLNVHAIVKRKVEDVEENHRTIAIFSLKIPSGMSDDTFLVHGFLMEPKLMGKILQIELQIQTGLKWPVRDVLSSMEFTIMRPSKIPASLLVDAQPKMWPLLRLSQFTGAIPSSGSIHQQPNGIADKGDLGVELISSDVTKADAPPGPPPKQGCSGGASSSAEPSAHPPEAPALNTGGGASRTQGGGGESDRMEPTENPTANESGIIEKNPTTSEPEIIVENATTSESDESEIFRLNPRSTETGIIELNFTSSESSGFDPLGYQDNNSEPEPEPEPEPAPESSPGCGCCNLVHDYFCNCCCSIL